MKIYDIITESQEINEAPMGMLSTIGNKLAQQLPTLAPNLASKATGRLETGKLANQLKTEFSKYLGQTGQEADTKAVISFLKANGYPTKAATAIGKSAAPTTGVPRGPATTTPKATATAKPATPASTPTVTATPPADTATPVDAERQAISAKRAAKTAAATTAARANMAANATQPSQAAQPVNYDEPTWKRKGLTAPATIPVAKTAAPAQVNYDEPTWKRKGQAAPTTTSAAPAITTPPTNLSNTPAGPSPIKTVKQLSQTPSAVKKRAARAAAKAAPVTAGFDHNEMYEAALPGSVIDKMLLAAAQEAAKVGYAGAPAPSGTSPQQTSRANTGSGQSSSTQSSGGFMSGLRQGLGQAPTDAGMDVNQIIAAAKALPPRDQQKLVDVLSRYIKTGK